MKAAVGWFRRRCHIALGHMRKKHQVATVSLAAGSAEQNDLECPHVAVCLSDSSFSDDVLNLAFGEQAYAQTDMISANAEVQPQASFESEAEKMNTNSADDQTDMTGTSEETTIQASLKSEANQANTISAEVCSDIRSVEKAEDTSMGDVEATGDHHPEPGIEPVTIEIHAMAEAPTPALQPSEMTSSREYEPDGEWAKLLPAFLEGLRATAIMHREAKDLEEKFGKAFLDLAVESQALEHQQNDLKQRFTYADGCTPATSQEVSNETQEELNVLAKKEGKMLRQRDAAEKNLAQFHRELREDQFDFFEMLEDLAIQMSLVEPRVLEEKPESKGAGQAADTTDGPENFSTALAVHEASPSQCASTNSAFAHKQRADVASSESGDVDAYRQVLQNLKTSRNEVLEAQWKFDNRYEQFDREDWELQRQLSSAAESVAASEPKCALDLRHLEQTREMTQRIISAEAHYERIKLAALELGFQDTSSDLESGFVDDVQDGYRLSSEQDIIASIDRGRINAWLDKLPDSADCQAETEVLTSPEESQECSLKEVEICDSASLVAEGPYRRRIDEWASRSKNVDIPEAEYSS